MSLTEKQKKKRKKRQCLILKEQSHESPTIAELVKVVEQLEKEGKPIEFKVCPKYKSPQMLRVKTMSEDLQSHLGWTQPKFECDDCGWQARLVLKTTNKRLSVKDVEIIAEAAEIGDQSQLLKSQENKYHKTRFHY